VEGQLATPRVAPGVWRFEFLAGESQSVTLRGLRFYSGTDELFPTQVPSQP